MDELRRERVLTGGSVCLPRIPLLMLDQTELPSLVHISYTFRRRGVLDSYILYYTRKSCGMQVIGQAIINECSWVLVDGIF
jgi:hypothetical protein